MSLYQRRGHPATGRQDLQSLLARRADAGQERNPVTEFNHIHIREGEDWICGRSMAFDDQELLRCEARHEEEDAACRRCAAQLLAHFGDAMHVQ